MNDFELQVGTIGLQDGVFPWKEKKMRSIELARIADAAGYQLMGDKFASCSTWLQYGQVDGRRKLAAANFCYQRLCPVCTARRARRAAVKLSTVMSAVEREKDCRFVFLTLTCRNCRGGELRETVGRLLEAWDRLRRQSDFLRAIGGWFRALEITRNGEREEYHPHLHVILAVSQAYFDRRSGLYITQKSWRERWRKSLRVDYDPRVHIEAVYEKRGRKAAEKASLEAAKYATKDSDLIDKRLPRKVQARIFSDYVEALRRRRLTAFGGWMKEAARRFEADDLEGGDLLELEDGESVRSEIYELVETYNWNFGVGDYILSGVQVNPMVKALKDIRKIS